MASLESTLAYVGALCDADETLAEALYTVLTERRARKKASDAGAVQDTDRSSTSATGNRAGYMTTAERTFGGLTPPMDDAERQATLSAENYFGTVGNLKTPDYSPSHLELLRAEFLQRPKASDKRDAGGKVVGGLSLPPE